MQSDKDRKKAEVRARLEQENEAKKKKKGGFMTPERKRKLRVSCDCDWFRSPVSRIFPVNSQNLLRKKAAEELKLEQARKEAEKKRIIEERVGQRKDLSSMNEGNTDFIWLFNPLITFAWHFAIADMKSITKTWKNTLSLQMHVVVKRLCVCVVFPGILLLVFPCLILISSSSLSCHFISSQTFFLARVTSYLFLPTPWCLPDAHVAS